MKRLFLVSWLTLGLILTGCATQPLPEDRYYRLAQPTGARSDNGPLLNGSLQVDRIRAPGVLNERQLLHSRAGSPAQLEQYNYHVWVDPPPQMIRRYLIDALRASNVARVTADRLPSGPDRYRLSGRLESFERVSSDGFWLASVAIELRVDSGDAGAQPALIKRYAAQVPADGNTVADSAAAFSAALSEIVTALVADLATMGV